MSMSALRISAAAARATIGLEAEWALVRTAYKKRALETHPDKTDGDEAPFRAVQAALEAFKSLKEATPVVATLFAFEGEDAVPATDVTGVAWGCCDIPSYEHCQAAAEEVVPGYKVMHAPGGKSACVKTKTPIAKGELRCGSLDPVSGAYGRWHHLNVWRVPAAVWTGLPRKWTPEAVDAALLAMEGLVIVGYATLDADAKALLCAHVANSVHHAKLTPVVKKSVALPVPAALQIDESVAGPVSPSLKATATTTTTKTTTTTLTATTTTTTTTLATAPAGVPGLPKPGVNDVAPAQLAGKICVLTGVFPELGGGSGMNGGKERAKAWLEAHGAKVTGSVSKKTTYIVCGAKPGMDKVIKGVGVGAKLTTLKILAEGLKGNDVAGGVAAQPVDETALSFSAGFGGNGLAKRIGGPSAAPVAKRVKSAE